MPELPRVRWSDDKRWRLASARLAFFPDTVGRCVGEAMFPPHRISGKKFQKFAAHKPPKGTQARPGGHFLWLWPVLLPHTGFRLGAKSRIRSAWSAGASSRGPSAANAELFALQLLVLRSLLPVRATFLPPCSSLLV